MARAGSGGSSGGHSSGGHANSRSSGGHHISSGFGSSGTGRRAGMGSSYSGGIQPRGGFHQSPPPAPPPPPPPRGYIYYGHPRTYIDNRTYYGNDYYSSTPYRSRRRSPVTAIITTLLIVFIVIAVILSAATPRSSIASTKNREKIDTGIAFQNDCIVDELGWFDNIPKTERRLKDFYDKTGIQPYIVLKAYDANLQSDADKEAYANEYYEQNIGNESTFLYMYFSEYDTDNDVGYMCYVNGKQVSSVMDAEAIDIFWNYMDNKWYSDSSTDDMFVSVFNSTADTIMTKSATMADVGTKIGTAVIIIVLVGGIVIVMNVRRKHKREEAEETERILNTPIDRLGNSSDPLVDKYTDTKE